MEGGRGGRIGHRVRSRLARVMPAGRRELSTVAIGQGWRYVMEERVRWLSSRLANRASRRGFLGLAGSVALGTGLAMHGLSVAAAAGCYQCPGCNGGQCDNAYAPPCSGCLGVGGDCPSGCSQSGRWYCCVTIYGGACQWVCTECCCGGNGCTCFANTGSACGAPGCAYRPLAAPATAAIPTRN